MPAVPSADPERAADRHVAVKRAFLNTLKDCAVPSDWLGCETVNARKANGRRGLHVQLVVHSHGSDLLPHVMRIQDSLVRGACRIDASAREWIFSVSWEFSDRPVKRAQVAEPAL